MYFIQILYSFLKSIFFDNDDEANFSSKNFKPRRWYTFFITIIISVLGIKALISSYSVVIKLTALEEVMKKKDAEIVTLKGQLTDCNKKH